MPLPEDHDPETDLKPRCVLVCQHQSCLKNGSANVLMAFKQLMVPGVLVDSSPCMGQCNIGPSVRITPDETWYYRVKPSDVPLIVSQHLQQGQPVEHLLNPRIHQKFSYYN